MVDETTLKVRLSWDDAQMGEEAAGRLLDEMVRLCGVVSVEGNWGRVVGEL